MLDNNGRALLMNDALLVNDNLDEQPYMITAESMERFVKRFPMKMTASCMLIVYEGSVTIGVNFRDFVATQNTCIIITEGTIVEKVVYEKEVRVIVLSYLQNGLAAPITPSQRNLHRLYALQVVLVHLQPPHLKMMKTVYGMLRTILSDPSFAANREATAYDCRIPRVSMNWRARLHVVTRLWRASCSVSPTITVSIVNSLSMPVSCVSRSSTCRTLSMSRPAVSRHNGLRNMSFLMPRRCCAAAAILSSKSPMS